MTNPSDQEHPAYPASALETAIASAALADPVIAAPDGGQHVMLPPNYKLQQLPDLYRQPPYVLEKITVDDRRSLAAYANRFKNETSVILADYDACTVSARLDWHPDLDHEDAGLPRPDKHSVTLKLRFSEEFERWDKMEGELHSQDLFARFLEENATDVSHPEAATMIEISRDFEATVGQTYKSAVRLDNGDRKIRFESDSKAMNDVVIPQRFTLQIPIYNGEPEDTLTALFRWRASGGEVRLGFEWHRLEYQRRAHFQQIAFTAAEETGLPVYIGRQG